MAQELKTKNIGLNVKPPKEVCNDPNCPFHGNIKVHGRILIAKVISTKSRKTAKVEWEEIVKVKKYERAYVAKRRLLVHNPECINAKPGDVVKIGETRPISKLKHFVILEIVKSSEEE